jgi:hypothetical protein
MLETISIFNDLLFYFNQIIKGEASFLAYFILILIPFAIIIAVRESFCWFFKVSSISKRLDKLDKRLLILNVTVEEIVAVLKSEIQKSKIRAGNDIRNTKDARPQSVEVRSESEEGH